MLLVLFFSSSSFLFRTSSIFSLSLFPSRRSFGPVAKRNERLAAAAAAWISQHKALSLLGAHIFIHNYGQPHDLSYCLSLSLLSPSYKYRLASWLINSSTLFTQACIIKTGPTWLNAGCEWPKKGGWNDEKIKAFVVTVLFPPPPPSCCL